MQAVILAAGRGERMGSLTEGTPKGLLQVAGKTLLEHKLDILPKSVDEVILVVGYMGSAIQSYFGGSYNGTRLFYAEQEEQHGTAGALWSASSILNGEFLVMNADDIYAKEDIARAADAGRWSVVGLESHSSGSAARIFADTQGRVKDVLEEGDEREEDSTFLNTGLYLLDTSVFRFPLVPKARGSAEFGLPQTLIASKAPLWLIPGTFWLQITAPEDLEKAADMLENRQE